MLARAGTLEGGMLCSGEWREMKATLTGPLGVSRVAIVMGEEGDPQGWRGGGLVPCVPVRLRES